MNVKSQRAFKTLVACVAALSGLAGARPAFGDRPSTYAGIPSTGSTRLDATATVTGTGLTRSVVLEEHAPSASAPIRSFDVDMEKRMHLIVVSDDLGRFMHVHPVLGADGRFRITVSFPGPGLYHLYADAVPSTFGHAVFRFDLPIAANAGPAAARHFLPIAVSALGDYTVRLSTDQVKAGADTPILISIMKDGEPASDLHPYLGAYAHIVAIGASDLSYTHVHAMSMDAMASGMPMDAATSMPATASVPATMPVHITLPRKGIYKVWVQFIGGSRLYVAPFVLSAM